MASEVSLDISDRPADCHGGVSPQDPSLDNHMRADVAQVAVGPWGLAGSVSTREFIIVLSDVVRAPESDSPAYYP